MVGGQRGSSGVFLLLPPLIGGAAAMIQRDVVFLIIFSIVSVNFAQSFLNDARDTVSLDPSFPANYDISSSGEKNKMCNGRRCEHSVQFSQFLSSLLKVSLISEVSYRNEIGKLTKAFLHFLPF